MTITQWRAIPTVPPSPGGTYNTLDALSENLRKAQSAINTLQSATYSGVLGVNAGTGLVANTVSGVTTISPGAELAGLAGLSTTGILQRTGTGAYTTTSLGQLGGAPGRAQAGVPVDTQNYGYIHENLNNGDIYVSHTVPTSSSPVVVHKTTTRINTNGAGTTLTLPFTPTPGNLVVIGGDALSSVQVPVVPSFTTMYAQTVFFDYPVWLARVWQAGDSNSIPFAAGIGLAWWAWEISGAGSGTVSSAFDVGDSAGTNGFSISGFSVASSVANELALCFTSSASITDLNIGLDATWTLDEAAGTGSASGHKVVGAAGQTLTATQTSNNGNTNRFISAIMLKPGIVTTQQGWSLLGPVSSYVNGTLVDSQLKSLRFTGSAISAATDGFGNITVSIAAPNFSSLYVGTTPVFTGTSGNILYNNGGSLGEYSLIPVAKGGTGTATPALVAGTNVTITGSWPNQTINATGGSSGITVGTTTITGGTSGNFLYNNAGVVGERTIIAVANGGTGTATPGLVAGTNVTITGSWPNQTINASGSGGSLTVQSSGTSLGTATTLNFTGSGVTTSVTSGVATVTVAGGGGGSALTIKDEGTTLTTGVSTLNFVGSGVTAAGTNAPPVVRGTSSGNANAGSIVCTFPTGTVAGDTVYIAVESGWFLGATPSGWTVLDNTGSLPNSAFAGVYSKVMTSGDIATGSVTMSFSGSYWCSFLAIAFVGACTQRAYTYSGTATTLTSSSAPQVGDIGVYFALSRGNVLTSISPGSVLESTSGSDTDAKLYSSTVSVAGAQSTTFTWSGAGGYGLALFVQGVPSTTNVQITIPGSVVKISQTVTSGSQTSVTFSSISNAYSDLIISVAGRSTDSIGVNNFVYVQCNSDTGTNYSTEKQYSYDSSTGVGQTTATTSLLMGYVPNAGATANHAGSCEAVIPNYKGTTFYKNMIATMGVSLGTGAYSQGAGVFGGTWLNTSAINALKVYPSGGSWADGTVVTLYGRG